MAKNVSVDTKSTQEKEKNINEERNKEYETLLERVRTFKFFQAMKKKIKEMEEDEDNNTEKIIREGEHSLGKEKYTLGVRAKFEVKFEYFEILKHPKFDDECVYLSRKFFFLKNIISDDEKKEIEKFENEILNKFYTK